MSHLIDRKNLSGMRVSAPAGATAPRFWRSLDELAQTPQFREMIEREFPDAASEWNDGESRRSFLKIMAASLALAGVGIGGGCTNRPPGQVRPYVRPPADGSPGPP